MASIFKKDTFFLCEKKPIYYEYLKLKYFLNKDDLEIIKLMKIDSKKVKILKNKLIEFVFKMKNIENFELNMEV